MHKYEKAIVISDIHVPFQDNKALQLTFEFIKWYKPSQVIIAGDLIDFIQISRFDCDPNRLLKIQDDIDETQAVLCGLRDSTNAKIDYLEGNHSHRLVKYLRKQPQIANLKVLSMETLLNLEPLKIKFIKQEQMYYYKNLLIEHGDIVRKHSGYTARGQMEKRGMSGISGHTHRLGTHYLRNAGGFYVWIENGCLCDLNPEYVKFPNWQQGFTILNHKTDGDRFDIQQLCITDGKLSFMGKEF